MKIQVNNCNQANWHEISVKTNLPEKLQKLDELANNLWWVWNSDAKNMFRTIDHDVWKQCGSNPKLMLRRLPLDKLNAMAKDKDFLGKLDKVYKHFRAYMDEPRKGNRPSVAYFSMEYGLTEVIKIYSGGLGVLAGDYIKEASDSNVDMTAIGFLYRYGYFTQHLSMEGQQIADYEAQNFNDLPIEQVREKNGDPMIVEVPYPGRIVYAYLWKVNVGRMNLYLLDTDNDKNSEFDRPITHSLYGGDWENRLKQEIMLGIGGILALKKLGIKKDIYHCNEGHAAFINIQRLLDYMHEDGLGFQEALEVVRASGLYTCHTPVPAGHDYFDEGLFGKYMGGYPEQLGLSWDEFFNMGRETPGQGKFSMSVFALNTCQEANGVSWLHGEVSKKMFAPIWKGYFPEELHVGYVTNGVHLPTWAASEWKAVYEKIFDKNFYNDQSNLDIWKAINDQPDELIWKTHTELKHKLIDFIRQEFQENWLKTQQDPSRIMSILERINPDALVIGFGRRFATYKRAHLLFTDLERLEKIVNNPERPVQFLFTGKAHPADGGGQGLIRRIVEISRMPQFLGKIIFLENYDMNLAKRLVSGVDIWLNTPTRPLEASGTSGEKAQMNGVLNFSVKDGWWLEGYKEGAGWALTEKRTYENQEHQDQLDAATIYAMLENEIVPKYYAKNSKGYSPEWIKTIKNSLTQITPLFTTKRMMDDYFDRFYMKEAKRVAHLKQNNYAKAREIAAWKENIANHWDAIEVTRVAEPEEFKNSPEVGKKYHIEIDVDIHDLNNNGLGIELVCMKPDHNNEYQLHRVTPMKLAGQDGSVLHFTLDHVLEYAGPRKYCFRMFPKNEDLPHRMDFAFVRWIEA